MSPASTHVGHRRYGLVFHQRLSPVHSRWCFISCFILVPVLLRIYSPPPYDAIKSRRRALYPCRMLMRVLFPQYRTAQLMYVLPYDRASTRVSRWVPCERQPLYGSPIARVISDARRATLSSTLVGLRCVTDIVAIRSVVRARTAACLLQRRASADVTAAHQMQSMSRV